MVGIIIFVVAAVLLTVWTSPWHPKESPIRKLTHNYLGWHTVSKDQTQWHDGASFHCVCDQCGKEVMQDSQGNWF